MISYIRGRSRFSSIATMLVASLAVVSASSCSVSDPTAVQPLATAPARAGLASTSGLVISQVYGGGGNSGATLTNDFIEIFNAGSTPVSVSGWSVQYASSAGTSWQVTALSGTIQPGSYYLVQEAAGAGGTTPLPTPDASGSIAMSGTSGKVALVSTTTALTGTGCPIGAPIEDYVGYGAANCFEGSAATGGLSNTTAALRNGNGTIDTNDNAGDFSIGTPNPRNSGVSIPVGGLVISQVYGGGGNSGATLTNDFIELYNAGATPVSVTGWSVQYASSAGTSWQVTALSGTIQPGSYYLVQEAAGAGGTTPLPTPDATGGIAMSATSGKVALVSSTTALTGTGCPIAAPIEDYVGYGSANCFEGTAATAGLSNTTAALRNGNGTIDTDDNAADFTTGAPNPRNSAAGAPNVASTTPADGAADVALDANIGITFTKPVTVSGAWFSIACTASGTHSATVTGGPVTYTLDPASDFAPNESCAVTIAASQVADASNPASTLPADVTFSFTTLSGNACALPYTGTYAIQGSGLSTPLNGQVVTTQGVVVGDYEGVSLALRGFYLQDATGDGDAATSDAIFVFNGNNDNVNLGDVVRVTGTAGEFQDQTQLASVSAVIVCSSGASVPTVDVTLPFASPTDAERYEAMLVRLPQTLYVTEHSQLGRFGQVVLSSADRLYQPTHLVAPGAAALAQQAVNDLNRIIVDDASQAQNPDPIVFARGGQPLSAANTLRGGDAATGIVGVMTYTWAGNAASGNAWRVRPLGALGGGATFAAVNARPATPAPVGGTLKVATMNLLNYFNTFTGCTNGVTGPATQCRGAEDAVEFTRQSQKTVAAIVAMNPDILGLVELENDGYGAQSAIADLVDKVNAATAPGMYAFVDVDAATGQVDALGTDAIKVGVLYKPASVRPSGNTASLNTAAFVNGGDGSPRNRPALAQTFRQPNNAEVVVVVNHFKSKGSACDVPDAGDGQGECAIVRTNAANQLAAWLATDPTGTGETDVLIMGDLNSYKMETPIAALTTGGYTDLASSLLGPSAYSYVFDGQWGYLDYALASSSLASQVAGVTEWHINADEPSVLDYNVNFKSPGQVVSLFAPDQYRVSDHDAVIVGLTLAPPPPRYALTGFFSPVANPPAVNDVRGGSAVPMHFSLGGDYGLDILAAGYPASQPISCTSGAVLGPLQQVSGPGNRPLSYNPLDGTYQFVWKSDVAWANSCRRFVLRLDDGSELIARFAFR